MQQYMYYTTVQSHYILPLHGIGLVSNNSYPVFILQGEPWREKEIKKVSLRGRCGGKGSGAFSNICCPIPTQKLLEVIVPFLELVMQFCLVYKAFSTLAQRLLHSKSAFLDDCLWHPLPPPSPLPFFGLGSGESCLEPAFLLSASRSTFSWSSLYSNSDLMRGGDC